MMREVQYEDIKAAVAKLAIDACCIQTPDIKTAFAGAKKPNNLLWDKIS